jgi:hypothetical protein
MTEADIIELLKQIGIVQEETDGTLSISTIADLTFIH